MLGDHLSALIEQQRRSFWSDLPPDSRIVSAAIFGIVGRGENRRD
jgi:hypothetical protein